MAEAAVADRKVTVTMSAAERVKVLLQMEGKPNAALRLTVNGGGCSGFQWGLSLDEAVNDDDRVFDEDGFRMVIDETSLELLAGAELDYVEEMIGASFQLRNPNASSTCGCGSSFSV